MRGPPAPAPVGRPGGGRRRCRRGRDRWPAEIGERARAVDGLRRDDGRRLFAEGAAAYAPRLFAQSHLLDEGAGVTLRERVAQGSTSGRDGEDRRRAEERTIHGADVRLEDDVAFGEIDPRVELDGTSIDLGVAVEDLVCAARGANAGGAREHERLAVHQVARRELRERGDLRDDLGAGERPDPLAQLHRGEDAGAELVHRAVEQAAVAGERDEDVAVERRQTAPLVRGERTEAAQRLEHARWDRVHRRILHRPHEADPLEHGRDEVLDVHLAHDGTRSLVDERTTHLDRERLPRLERHGDAGAEERTARRHGWTGEVGTDLFERVDHRRRVSARVSAEGGTAVGLCPRRYEATDRRRRTSPERRSCRLPCSRPEERGAAARARRSHCTWRRAA